MGTVLWMEVVVAAIIAIKRILIKHQENELKFDLVFFLKTPMIIQKTYH